jgi:hypothetical protein
VVIAMFATAIDPFATRKRGELAGDSLTVGLMADNAVLRVNALADDLGVDRGCRLNSATGPVHRVALVDIAAEPPAVEGKVEPAKKEGEHERSDKPGGEGRPVGVAAVLLVVLMVVIHG